MYLLVIIDNYLYIFLLILFNFYIILYNTFFFFFAVQLRIEQGNSTGQLIFYKRSNISGPKQSDYMINIVSNPSDLKETLSNALGLRGQ